MSSKDDNKMAILNTFSKESKNNPIDSQKHIQTSLNYDASSKKWQPEHFTTECLPTPITPPPKPQPAGSAPIPSGKVPSSLPQKFTKTGNKKDYKN
jgi:hypothetical protein